MDALEISLDSSLETILETSLVHTLTPSMSCESDAGEVQSDMTDDATLTLTTRLWSGLGLGGSVQHSVPVHVYRLRIITGRQHCMLLLLIRMWFYLQHVTRALHVVVQCNGDGAAYAEVLTMVAEANKPKPAKARECTFIHICCYIYNKVRFACLHVC